MSDFPVTGLSRVDVNGARLAYLERGRGEPVVFVHGSMSDLRTWLPQMDAFGAEYRSVAYSRRYARPNDDIPEGRDDQMLPHVDDLLALLRALALAPAHLVGNSWGAFVCLLAAIREPSAVRSLVLGEPPVLPLFISNNPGPGELARLLFSSPRDALTIIRFGGGALAPAQKAFRRGDTEAAMAIFGAGVLGTRAGTGFQSIPAARQEQMRANVAAARAQLLGDGFPPVTAAAIEGIRTPTLLVTGRWSPAIFRRTITDRLQRLLPNVERVEISDASHLMHEQNPAGFNAAVRRFLERR